MRKLGLWGSALVFGTLLAACGAGPGQQASTQDGALATQSVAVGSPIERRLTGAGSHIPQAGLAGSGALEYPEFAPEPEIKEGDFGAASVQSRPPLGINRSLPGIRPGRGVNGGGNFTAQGITFFPKVKTSFDGLNLRDQRTANGGKQFTVEPPDQALCVGNGYVLESVNDVLRVYDRAGNPKTGVVDLNTFYGYPPAIDRATQTYGPSITDPICLYDAPTKRWFHVVLTLAVDPKTDAFSGANTLDIAVSQTADPTGAWNIYRLPVQNDGTEGTPVHKNCPCIGDYPQIGADANGFYVTTNEFPFFEDGFNGAQIYAIDKRALATGDPNPRAQQFDLSGSSVGAATVRPAVSPGKDNFEGDANGTEYFISSLVGFDQYEQNGQYKQIAVWGLSNTRSLRGGTPDLSLNALLVNVNPYAVPGVITQKKGDFPLGQCINDTTLVTPFGKGCWNYLFDEEPPHNETISPIDGNDGRIGNVVYANGELWGALDTAIQNGSGDRVGVAWYVLKPGASKKEVVARVKNQGYVTAPGANSVTRPAIAMNDDKKGVIGFTLAGPDYFPSAAFAGIDSRRGSSQVYVAAAGKGVQDGFSGYKAFAGGTPPTPRPRWGDYGAAFSDGSTLWVANEYIGQTCTLAQYATTPFGSCGATRVTLGNWGTRVSAIDVGE